MTPIRAVQFFTAVSFTLLALNGVLIFGKHAQPSYAGFHPKYQGPECCTNSTCNECFNCMDYWGCSPWGDPPTESLPCLTPPPCECATCEPCYGCPTIPPCECATCEPCYGCPTIPPCECTCATCEPCHECPTTPPLPTCPTTVPPATCPPPDPCPTCPTLPPPTTESPRPSCIPKFSRAIYQSSLPSWPTAGTNVRLGLNASTEDGTPVHFQLVTPFDFLTLSATNDIIFTSNVSEGAYIGPNNVMIIEVIASVIGDESRANSAVIVIVFPRSTVTNDEILNGK